MSYSEEFVSVTELPLPAVTICYPIPFRLGDDLLDFDQLKLMVEQDLVDNMTLNLFKVLMPTKYHFTHTQYKSEIHESAVIPKGFQSLPSLIDNGVGTVRIFTQHGFCYTENMLDRVDILRNET